MNRNVLQPPPQALNTRLFDTTRIRTRISTHPRTRGLKTMPLLFREHSSQIPAPVLAEITGITPNAAIRWAALAARDWSRYIADR